jgi:hypothetical protein
MLLLLFLLLSLVHVSVVVFTVFAGFGRVCGCNTRWTRRESLPWGMASPTTTIQTRW